MRIIAIINQKGGVGKTTTAVNLSASLAVAEKKVLLVDLDPQGNATVGFGVDITPTEASIYEALVLGKVLHNIVVDTRLEYLQILPSDERLYGAELELVGLVSRETRLKDALETLSAERYDFIILDCPPSLGLLTINALTVADSLLIPLPAEYLPMRGLAKLHATINLVTQELNTSLKIEGVLLTLYQPQFAHTKEVETEIRKYYSPYLYDTKIRQCIKLSEAHSFGQPAILYDIISNGAQDYLRLAGELLNA